MRDTYNAGDVVDLSTTSPDVTRRATLVGCINEGFELTFSKGGQEDRTDGASESGSGGGVRMQSRMPAGDPGASSSQ